jgi:bifunctional DNA-binding transcriptional regulator/antitoxin component of YhaV-PrlF toxin-antitoxin module
MNEAYRMRIADRRQVMLPQRMLDVLGLEVGDEFGIEVSEGGARVIAYKRVRSDLMTPEIQRMLDEREREVSRPTTIGEIMRLARSGSKGVQKKKSAPKMPAAGAYRPSRVAAAEAR